MKKNTIFKYCASLALGLTLCSEISASWTDQIIAGQLGQSGYSGDGGQATSAKLAQPHAVAFDSIGDSLYIADSSNHAVRKVNASGIISTLSMSGIQNPQGICLNSAGKLYVADQDRNVISMYDTTTGSFTANFITGIFPQSVCVDGSGNIYIARNFPARVSKYSASGSLINADFITGLVNPKGIWADSSMNIYVADANANSIGKYTVATSTYNSTFITGLNFPHSVFGDGLGNIYVANSSGNSIMVRSPSGSISTFISGLNNPQGICVDNSNNVYIADTNSFIVHKLLSTTSLSIDVEGSDSASHSGAITATTLYKTNGGALALSSTSNAIGNLGIHGGKVSVSAASNLNGASSAVTFAASGTDPVSHASNTATLEIAGSMNTGAFAFTSDGTVQVDGSNVATLSAAPTGTGLVRKTGAGVMKVASDLSASVALAGIHVDAGTLNVQSGKAPVAPIAVASSAVMELGAGLAAGSVGGAVTVASGAEMLVDASATVPHQNTSLTYTFDITTGYYRNGSSVLPWPADFAVYGDTDHGLLPNWVAVTGHTTNSSYGNATNIQYYDDGNGKHYYSNISNFTPKSVPTTSDIFTGTLGFSSGSKLALGAGSTWARNITVGTAS